MTAKAGRITLGLYNCYDAGRWHDIDGALRRHARHGRPPAQAAARTKGSSGPGASL